MGESGIVWRLHSDWSKLAHLRMREEGDCGPSKLGAVWRKDLSYLRSQSKMHHCRRKAISQNWQQLDSRKIHGILAPEKTWHGFPVA